MPPRRKKTADDNAAPAAPTPATRSSARVKANAKTTTNAKGAADVEAAPKGAGSSKAATQTKAKTTSRKRKSEVVQEEGADEPATKRKTKTGGAKAAAKHDDTKPQAGSSTSNGKSVSTKRPEPPQPAVPKHPTYQMANVTTLFNTYADEDDTDVIGPEGLERLCDDACISMEGALPLLLAWQLEESEMGKLSRPKWAKRLDELKIDNLPTLAMALNDLDDLLVSRKANGKAALKNGTANDPYNKTWYKRYAANVNAAFTDLYNFCFALAKDDQARNINIDIAMAFWSVLLMPQYPIMTEIVTFINEKVSYKGVNKDLWTMMLEFCQTVKPSLEGYDSDGAWPTMLDDFVQWKKEGMDTSG